MHSSSCATSCPWGKPWAAHGALNIGAVFLFWPVALALMELWIRRRSDEAKWFAAVLIAGFAPALFMLSTWPHIPRWYGYGFPSTADRLARLRDDLGVISEMLQGDKHHHATFAAEHATHFSISPADRISASGRSAIRTTTRSA